MELSKHLIAWYLHNKRDLPWRNTIEPYQIWLSEIILQQTRIDQGMAYYVRFLEHFPTIHKLALASEEQVLKLWQGLGYYSRARNLHHTAKHISKELDGVFPENYKSLIQLKGIGDYTAAAIASICFHEPTAVVDGNVYRALSRYFGIDTPINSTKGIKEFKLLAQQLIDVNNPGTHNQALMEFGAKMCKPQNPDCDICPLNSSCVALSKQTIKLLPIKNKNIKIRNRFFNYLVVQSENGATKIVKREKGIWLNLYEFPLYESDQEIDHNELMNSDSFNSLFKDLNVQVSLFNKKMIVHKLTHQHIYAKFWIVRAPKSEIFSLGWEAVQKYPVPTLIDNFLKQFKVK